MADETIEMEEPLHLKNKKPKGGPGPLIALGIGVVLLVLGAEAARRTLGTKEGTPCRVESDCVGWEQVCVVPEGEVPYCSNPCGLNEDCAEGYVCLKALTSVYDERLRRHVPVSRQACVVHQ